LKSADYCPICKKVYRNSFPWEIAMTENSLPYSHLRTATGSETAIGELLTRIGAAFAVWRLRSRQRRFLAQMYWRQGTDLGAPRDAVEREIAKPFWRA
jgi:uncharacterized protein YjiS (DUF1127 family)